VYPWGDGCDWAWEVNEANCVCVVEKQGLVPRMVCLEG